MESLLLNLSRLKHFELHAEKDAIDLANGQRWENISGSLVTFNFLFYVTLPEGG
ncbi:unnamed protein product, partial [Rotaria sp. Silwood1]